jgi:glycosyltransferase involved in cell wall biosynthesis
MRSLKIAIATGGRFHVLDLARELGALGHDVRFYSYVPRKRAIKFGLPAQSHVALLPLMFPFLGWEWLRPKLFPAVDENLMVWALNRAVIARLAPCEVFICMSGLFLEAAVYAKRKYGARVFLERGSQHILSQKEILEIIPGAQLPSDFMIHRELAGYELADRIVVPSNHVVESFARQSAAAAKLFKNPYGANLEQFPQQRVVPSDRKTVLFVGGWSYRKGADVLVDAIRRLDDVRLIHVGGLGDVPFPEDLNFTHYDPVPQWQLKEFYARAQAFVLASREEGLALVQIQALASGLPLVCTDRTGGLDLAHSPALRARICVVTNEDAKSLAGGIAATLEKATVPPGLPLLSARDRQLLSWSCYAERYSKELLNSQ